LKCVTLKLLQVRFVRLGAGEESESRPESAATSRYIYESMWPFHWIVGEEVTQNVQRDSAEGRSGTRPDNMRTSLDEHIGALNFVTLTGRIEEPAILLKSCPLSSTVVTLFKSCLAQTDTDDFETAPGGVEALPNLMIHKVQRL
jgi:hypothetical protein